MIEPPEGVRTKPGDGGAWPMSFMAVTLPDNMPVEIAVYEVCSLSRRLYWGVRGDLRGIELRAFPHETTDQVCNRYRRLLQEKLVADKRAEAASRLQPLGERWTTGRKMDVLNEIDGAARYAGSVEAILTKYGLDEEEVAAWRAAFAVRGESGLKAGRSRA